MKRETDIPFKIDYSNEQFKTFLRELRQFRKDPENIHKVSSHNVLHLLPDRIGKHRLTPFEKVTILMEGRAWTSDRNYISLTKDGTLTIAESIDEKGKVVKLNDCQFDKPSDTPDKALYRFTDDSIHADQIPDKIRGIEVKDYNKAELITNGMTTLFVDALYVGIAYQQYLIWTEKFSDLLGKPYDFQCATAADIIFEPRHELAALPDKKEIVNLYLAHTAYADRLETVANGLPGGTEEYISIMGLTKFIPDVVHGNALDMMTKINLLVFGRTELPDGSKLSINIEDDCLMFSERHPTIEGGFLDHIVQKNNCVFETDKTSLEIPAFLYPVQDTYYKIAKNIFLETGKRLLTEQLLKKFPDVINGHHLSEQHKAMIILTGTSKDLNNHKISLDPNLGVLYYASRTFNEYGVPQYHNRVIKQNECSYSPLQIQKQQSQSTKRSPKKDKGKDMGL